jgi:hypothetical protein
MTLILLREMRARMEERFGSMDGRFDSVEQKLAEHDRRFDALEKKIDVIKQAAFAESILGRYAVTEVEERLAIEARLAALEGRS